MAERQEEPEAATEQGLDQASPAAVAIALGRTSKGSKVLDADASAFLRKQTRLIDLQTEHLHEQRELQTSRLRWGRFSDRMKAMLQVMTAIVGLAVAGAVGIMAWQAHEDHGLTIAAFSVPPDLAQRGINGQVVATHVLDRLSDLQAQTLTDRPASTYANAWDNDIKVEIPETGVSVGELNSYLRQWLGQVTHVSGEIVRTPTGLAVTARAGEGSAHTAQGPEANLDALVQQAAEAVYAETQPYRWAVYLQSHGKPDDALAIYQRLAASGPRDERAWAYTGWASLLLGRREVRSAADKAALAMRLNPWLEPAQITWGLSQNYLGHMEELIASVRRELRVLQSGRAIGVQRQELARRVRILRGVEASILSDNGRAVALYSEATDPINFEGSAGGYDPRGDLAAFLARNHEVLAAKRITDVLANEDRSTGNTGILSWKTGVVASLQARALDDWPAAANDISSAPARAGWEGDQRTVADLADIYAHMGRFAEADTLVSGTPLDCETCVMRRGSIAGLEHDWPKSDRWFAEAVRLAPSFPEPYVAWGDTLLAKGDVDGAIAQLALAHRKGPHFADPMELWGEALMRKSDFAGAIAKFAEADKDSPRWGRNHLRWGEALMLAGRYPETRAQYVAANGMDLSRPDRAALGVLLARTASGLLHG